MSWLKFKKNLGKFIKPILIWITINLIFLSKISADTAWEEIQTIETNFIKVLESTPHGLLAGEFDTRIFLIPPPNNSVYLSKDFGRTWDILGLEKRGVLDLKYFDGKIYATTYYTIDSQNGLFFSSDMGESWQNIGPDVSLTKVDRDSKTIYLGTKNYGVYTSQDEGLSWVKIFDGSGTLLQVNEIQSSEDITIVSVANTTYKTTDNGATWEEIEFLKGMIIKSLCINGNVIFAGSSTTTGLYMSKDFGLTWEKVQSFGNYNVEKIIFFSGIYYVGRYNPENQTNSVYFSSDEGISWNDTGLNNISYNKVSSLSPIFSKPSYLFSVITNTGIFKYQIPSYEPANFPFLNIPWEFENENELTDNITSFFDHSYPLLGYSYFAEPEIEKYSTLNFLGYKDVQPKIYYSSHSGIDFSLKYGTNILASASGYATYYYCKDCGNSIKIDHENGYQTTYMHLQDEGLLTKKDKIWVNNNDIIGKVGLTGRTSGPHLHFEVTKDKNLDGSFLNDFPMGRTDPFGWQVNGNKDPWEIFSWEDSLGNHMGSLSSYLWNIQNKKTIEVVTSKSNPEYDSTLNLDNKNIEFKNIQDYFTAKILSYAQPVLDISIQAKKYIKNTSFILEIYDQLGNKIKNFTDPINISIDINFQNLEDIDLQSLSLYFWDEITQAWEKIPSIIDAQNQILKASIDHLSWFAVLGDKLDDKPPITNTIVSGTQIDGWFIEYPLVEFLAQDNFSGVGFTSYSIDEGDFWHNYSQPFYIEQDGIVNLLYKSQDINGNLENENSYVIHINTKKLKTGINKINKASFSVSN